MRNGVLLFVVLLLSACDGGVFGTGSDKKDGKSVTVSGAAQKGPFVINSSVLINHLLNNGTSTDTTIVSKTLDSIGNFSFETDKHGPVQISVEGYHYNELTGNLSQGPLQLKSIHNVTASGDQIAFVNILTHLIHNRVLILMADGVDVDDAISQAENELLSTLSPALAPVEIENFSHLSLYNVEGTENVGNAYLLALSSMFYALATERSITNSSSLDAELTLLLNTVASDFSDDGQIEAAEILTGLAASKDLLDSGNITLNLENQAFNTTGELIEVADIGSLLEGLLQGISKIANQVIITYPAKDSVVRQGQIRVRADIPIDAGVESATLYVDGLVVAHDNDGAPWEFDWDSYYWGDDNRHSLLIKATTEDGVEVRNGTFQVRVSSTVNEIAEIVAPSHDTQVKDINSQSLSLKEIAHANQYIIEYGHDGYDTTVISENTVALLTGLDLGKYNVRYRAKRVLSEFESIEGPWSEPISFEILPPDLPQTNPVQITKTSLGYDVRLSWQDLGDDSKYMVYVREVQSSNPLHLEVSSSESGVLITELASGRYIWQMMRINEFGHESILSNEETLELGAYEKRFGGSEDIAKSMVKWARGNPCSARWRKLSGD